MKGLNLCRPSRVWIFATVLTLIIANYCVDARSTYLQPRRSNENYVEPSKYLLLQKLEKVMQIEVQVLEDEQRLRDAQQEVERLIQESESSREQAEMLPVPSAIVQRGSTNSAKRTSYLTLCHFKICNMGSKRHL